MKIAIIATGSQGDVQPYIALGKGLKAAGHTVRLLSNENYQKAIAAQGLDFWPLRGNVQEIAESEEIKALLEKGNFIEITRKTAAEAKRAALNWAQDGLAACAEMDFLVAGMGGLYLGIALGEKLNIPLIQAYVVPFTPTTTFPSALFPQNMAKMGGAINKASHHLLRQMMWQGFRGADGAVRTQVLHLPSPPFAGPYHARPLKNMPTLYGISPAVLPRPADWGADVHLTGYWFADAPDGWAPPESLTAFLQSGPPPVYIGFGSMSNRNPQETANLVLRALEQTGQRAVMLAGWGGLRADNAPSSVFVIDSVPHAWLFPRMAAVVHHGGAGTTAAGLRAGVPSVIIPFFGDQPFWGHRAASLGVGPAAIPRKQLTTEKLAAAIQSAITNKTMREKAAALGEKIRAEEGIANAVRVFDQMARK
ncbi:MAG TPA: glycosyltransferase [Thermoflexales bacterium]|nr:glycosyltransferase [Thermoflexales bacterium]